MIKNNFFCLLFVTMQLLNSLNVVSVCEQLILLLSGLQITCILIE